MRKAAAKTKAKSRAGGTAISKAKAAPKPQQGPPAEQVAAQNAAISKLQEEIMNLQSEVSQLEKLENLREQEIDDLRNQLNEKKEIAKSSIEKEEQKLKLREHKWSRCYRAKQILEDEGQQIDIGFLNLKRLHLEEPLREHASAKDKMDLWYRSVFNISEKAEEARVVSKFLKGFSPQVLKDKKFQEALLSHEGVKSNVKLMSQIIKEKAANYSSTDKLNQSNSAAPLGDIQIDAYGNPISVTTAAAKGKNLVTSGPGSSDTRVLPLSLFAAGGGIPLNKDLNSK